MADTWPVGHLRLQRDRYQYKSFPSFGRGLHAALFESSYDRLSELIYRGFFAPVKPFWTVLDPIQYLSPSESAA